MLWYRMAAMMKPKGVPQMNPDDFTFEFTEMDPRLTPVKPRANSIDFSNSLLQAFESVKTSNLITRMNSLDNS